VIQLEEGPLPIPARRHDRPPPATLGVTTRMTSQRPGHRPRTLLRDELFDHPRGARQPSDLAVHLVNATRLGPCRAGICAMTPSTPMLSPRRLRSSLYRARITGSFAALDGSCYGTPRPARGCRPDLVGRLPRPGSSRTVPVPSHCRQSSTLIPMQSSAASPRLRCGVPTWPPPGRRRAARRRRIRRRPSRLLVLRWRLSWSRGLLRSLWGRRLPAGAAPQGRGEVEPVRVAADAYHPLGRVDQEGSATG
jgi:hypothetical protein